jgi:hypothetical protein
MSARELADPKRTGLMLIVLSGVELVFALVALAAYQLDWFGPDNLFVVLVAFALAVSALVLSQIGMKKLKAASEIRP